MFVEALLICNAVLTQAETEDDIIMKNCMNTAQECLRDNQMRADLWSLIVQQCKEQTDIAMNKDKN